MSYFLSFLAGYLLGSLPFSYLLGKLRGVDLRKVGSGNIGATNLARTCGKPFGILGFLLDAGKGVGGVMIGGLIASLFGGEEVILKIFGGRCCHFRWRFLGTCSITFNSLHWCMGVYILSHRLCIFSLHSFQYFSSPLYVDFSYALNFNFFSHNNFSFDYL